MEPVSFIVGVIVTGLFYELFLRRIRKEHEETYTRFKRLFEEQRKARSDAETH